MPELSERQAYALANPINDPDPRHTDTAPYLRIEPQRDGNLLITILAIDPMVVPTRRGRLPRPWTSNDRVHWRTRHRYSRIIRRAVATTARSLAIGPQEHIVVGLHYRPGDRRRRDAPNLNASQKPAVDGLVDAGVVPDDTSRWVTELQPTIHDEPGPRELWLSVEAGHDSTPTATQPPSTGDDR